MQVMRLLKVLMLSFQNENSGARETVQWLNSLPCLRQTQLDFQYCLRSPLHQQGAFLIIETGRNRSMIVTQSL